MNAEAAPARNLVSDTYSNIIKGGPMAYRSIAPQVDFAKQQFANSRRTLRDTVPNGGALPGASRQLAAAEAGTISNLYRDNITNALSGLAGTSQATTNAGLTATGGLTSTGTALAQMAAQKAQNVYGALGGIAGAIGSYFGGRRNTITPMTPVFNPE